MTTAIPAARVGALNISVTAVDEITNRIEELMKSRVKDVAAAMFQIGHAVRANAIQQTPLDFGPLRGSAYVTAPEVTESSVMVEIGYGGPAAAYAVEQHERLDFAHEVGNAKFLENAINKAAPTLVSDIAVIVLAKPMKSAT